MELEKGAVKLKNGEASKSEVQPMQTWRQDDDHVVLDDPTHSHALVIERAASEGVKLLHAYIVRMLSSQCSNIMLS